MQITRNSTETRLGPGDWFTGAVYIDAVAADAEGNTATWGEQVTDEEYAAAPLGPG